MHLNSDDAAKLADELLDLDTRSGLDSGHELVGVPRELSSRPGGRLGNYRVTRLVGSGGMGEVYEAEQDNPKRRVALKVVRSHLLTAEVRRRFEHEVRILGSLHHPGIAQIYEAGQFERVEAVGGNEAEAAGTSPFFAMEFVEGEPLTKHAADRKFGVRERLELFLRVCHAVEHAHQRGVIHRDLKPGNILVTRNAVGEAGSEAADAIGQPKVLDFGVARATDADLAMTSMQSEVGKLIGTLPYMSPEQAGGDSRDLDTRSDVYALGVVLYELLSGKLPYELKGEGGARVAQALRVIKEVDPAPLSSIDRVFRGDLETIVAKAMEKDRARRYQSVGELSSDIRRYLADEPVVARRASVWYQGRKFARRNRQVAMFGLAGVVLLSAATGVSGYFAIREFRARGLAEASAAREQIAARAAEGHRASAEEEAEIARETAAFFQTMLRAASPSERGKDATVMEVVREAKERLESGGLADRPALRAALFNTTGTTLMELGDLPAATECFRTSLEMRKQIPGLATSELVNVSNNLATTLSSMGELAEARALFESCASMLGEDPPVDTASAHFLNNYATFLMDEGRPQEALPVLEKLIEIAPALWGRESPGYMTALGNYATNLTDLKRYDEAERMLVELVELRRRVDGLNAPGTLTTQNNLGSLYMQTKRFAEAEQTLRPVWEVRRDTLGATHHATLNTLGTLGQTLEQLGRNEEAAACFQETIDGASAAGLGDAWAGGWRGRYGMLLAKMERWEEAELQLKASLESLATASPDDFRVRVAKERLANFYESWGKEEKAAEYRVPRPK